MFFCDVLPVVKKCNCQGILFYGTSKLSLYCSSFRFYYIFIHLGNMILEFGNEQVDLISEGQSNVLSKSRP